MKQKLLAIARILVSVGILAYLFNGIFRDETRKLVPDLETMSWADREHVVWTKGPAALWEVFQHVSLVWFAGGVACIGIVCVLGITRWRSILHVQGLELSFGRATSIFFVGMFFNALTLIMMGIYWRRVFDDPKLITFSILTLGFVLACVVGTILGFWRGFVDKVPGLRARLQRLPKYDMFKRMVDAYRQYAAHPMVLVNATLQSFCVHLASMASIWCIGQGLNITTQNGLIDYLLYLPIINSVTAIPISISGFGVREGMYAAMFGQVGVSRSLAVALSLLGYLAGLVWSLFGAIFYLTHRKEVSAIEHEQEGQ
jgi:hypothetical protein